ncbi:MAG: hypothetical protein HY356_05645 [Gammaproteobacteria bacterium]|nr:hypothetical protein [Gammaproteobacteria bacterium]
MLQSITRKREYIILALMLVLLHFSMWVDFGSPLSRALILVHLGLFLIWQPVQRRDQRYVWYNGILFIGLILAFVYWINWWFMFGWLIMLIGLVGGRVVTNQIERNFYFLVMIFLVSELLIGCIPRLFAITTSTPVYNWLKYAMPVLPLILPFFPQSTSEKTVLSVDLLHAITASLLASLLALGSLVLMYHNGTDYFTALIQTLFAIGISLLAISLLLTPHAGFSGLPQLWSRSLLNIGTPFEQWLSELSKLRQEHKSAEKFLESAIEKLVALPWIAGVKWNLPKSEGVYGVSTKHEINLTINDSPVTLYTHVPIGGALLLHCNLLIQLIENFYEAKIYERELSLQTHLQAIYETGARITHDIKNLLQSMHSMITIVQADSEVTDSKSMIIVKRQFPYFIQRLELAMSKLQTPQQTDQDKIYFMDWWRELKSHYKGFNIVFGSDIQNDPLIPFDLFNNVSENLLENAISKRKNEPDIVISITATSNNNFSVMVCDTGSAIDDYIVNLMFKEPVESNDGLGIGLYQAAGLAESSGYSLTLKNNTTGKVCFELSRKNQGVDPRNF